MKDKQEVINKFNEQVNMSANELRVWLDSPESRKAGTGVGIESGNKIVDILTRNPNKDPAGYTDEDIEHMRRVVSYNSRHLAQEDHLKETKTPEELEKTKSTISLRNWGHDPIKELKGLKRKGGSESPKITPTKSGDPPSKDADKTENPGEADTQTARNPPVKRTKTDRDRGGTPVQGAKQQSMLVDQSDSAKKGAILAIAEESGSPRRNPPRHAKRNSLIKE